MSYKTLRWPLSRLQSFRVDQAQKKRFIISIVLDPSDGFTHTEIRLLHADLFDLGLQVRRPPQ